MPDHKYRCDACHGTFIAAWSEADALAEKEANGWGKMDYKNMAQVCDDCYEKIMKVNNHKLGQRKE